MGDARVVVDDYFSDWRPVTSRLPQGLVLGPLLCVIFIIDLDDNVVNLISKFADDTMIGSDVGSKEDFQSFQKELDLEKWEYQICTLVWPNAVEEIIWDVYYSLVDFAIPGLIVVVSYTKILKITKAASRRLQANRPHSVYLQQISVSKQDYWLFRTLLVLILSFFIMWTPISLVIFLLIAQNFKGDLQLSSTWFFWVSVFTLANSAVNPILYGTSQCKSKWKHMLNFFSLSRFKNRGSLAAEHVLRRVRTQDHQTLCYL
ncbi:free fatty acid receptor 4-like [Narcine bancroftii]|uniref:free fatty acid receptor 4-like n=1 Tax=Narcine bancroftii TaxID=1343680 RepID=UPI0038320D3B